MSVRIQKQTFDISSEISVLTQGLLEVGAVVTFLGCVRGNVHNRPLKSMTLEHYPGMTEKELGKIEKEANERWKLEESLIIHRVGELLPREHIVLVVTAAQHRREAFEAGEFLMDFLKSNAPFWKKELFEDGTVQWTKAHEKDEIAIRRWKIET